MILSANLQEAESLYRQIYEPRAPLMRFLTDLGIPLPKGFAAAAEFVVNNYLRAALEQPTADPKRVINLLETAKLEGVTLEEAILEFAYRRSLERLAMNFTAEPSPTMLRQFYAAASLLSSLPFNVNLWKVQNIYYDCLKRIYRVRKKSSDSATKLRVPGSDASKISAACLASRWRSAHLDPRRRKRNEVSASIMTTLLTVALENSPD